MGLAGRQKMEREFSREIVINAYLGKIRELAPAQDVEARNGAAV